ncbi:hypothetical protein PFISCL1PPCAC_18287, partial [Pristionchus fissidentatus]
MFLRVLLSLAGMTVAGCRVMLAMIRLSAAKCRLRKPPSNVQQPPLNNIQHGNDLLEMFLMFVENRVNDPLAREGTPEDLRRLKIFIEELPSDYGNMIVVDMRNAPVKTLDKLLPPSIDTLVGVDREGSGRVKNVNRFKYRLESTKGCEYSQMDDRFMMAVAISCNCRLLTNDSISNHFIQFREFLEKIGADVDWDRRLREFVRERAVKYIDRHHLI